MKMNTIESRDHTMKGARSILIVLTIINLFNYIDRYVLSAVLEPLKEELNITDDGDLGRLATAFMLGYFLTSPIFGYLGDKFSRKKLMVIGIIGWSLGTCLTGIAQAFSFMIFCRVLVGLGEASFGAIGPAVISDAFDKSRRNNAMTIFYLAVPLGAAIGFTLGGLIASSWGWREAFIFAGLPGFLLALILLFVPEPTRGQSDGIVESKKLDRETFKALFKNQEYLLAVGGYIFYTFSMGAFSFWGPAFLSRVHELNVKESSMFFGPALVVTGILGTVIGGFMANKWQVRSNGGYAKLLSFSVLIAAPFSYYAFITEDVLICMVSISISLLFLFMCTGPINTVIMNVVPSYTRSTAMAIAIFSIHAFGDLWSPEIIGRTSDAIGNLRNAMLILPTSFIFSGIVWFYLFRKQNNSSAV